MRRAFLLPVVFATYSLAYLDRANFGFGAAAGLAHTLGITESRTALLGALFFLGYCMFQIPGMVCARRVSPTRLAFVALLAWGALAALTGVIHSFVWLAVDRLLLGEVFAMVKSVGALGGFAGSYLVGFLQAITHRQRAGFLLMSVSLLLAGLLLLLLPRAASQPVSQVTPLQVPEADLA